MLIYYHINNNLFKAKNINQKLHYFIIYYPNKPTHNKKYSIISFVFLIT